jgi:probable phosphoglycerate mutase
MVEARAGRRAGTRVILVRHGETAWNVEGRLQGDADSPLTAAGEAQARALAERFAREPFDVLYSSDLGRARQTAEAVSARTGQAIRLHAGLRERGLGVFQGLCRAEVEARHPDEWRRLLGGDWDFAPPGGESTRGSVARFVTAVTEIADAHAGETVAMVTHGGVLGGFLREVVGIREDHPRRYRRFNASWNVFAREEGRWYLHTWGDVSHLPNAGSLDDI